jgi:Na+/melibiose symporter-like transporter
MRNPTFHVILLVVLAISAAQPVYAQQDLEQRVAKLEQQVANQHSIQVQGPSGALLLLLGAFCALWAQNTNRNAWLWFFLGIFFSVITIIVLLVKNSDDRKSSGRRGIVS